MKRLKSLTLALSLLTGLTLTSCLNGESDPYTYNRDVITKVNSYMGGIYYSFNTPDNRVSIEPTESSINSIEANNSGFSMASLQGKIVTISYRWNNELNPIADDATTYEDVELLSIGILDAPTNIFNGMAGTGQDSTHCVISINPQVNGYTYQPYFFDSQKRDIVVPVDHFYPYGYNKARPVVSLNYYPQDPQTAAAKAENHLLLHLEYRVGGIGTFSTEYKSSLLGVIPFYKAFNLNNILAAYGGTPDQVLICAPENQYSIDLDDTQTQQKTYPVLTFEEFEDEFYH